MRTVPISHLGGCKQIEKNAPWKYSRAFIIAYCDESEGKVIYQYKQALKIPYNHMLLISFIEDILEEEPHKNMLRLALVLLYLKLRQTKTAQDILEEYLENKQMDSLDENTIKQMRKIYGSETIEKLLKPADDGRGEQ